VLHVASYVLQICVWIARENAAS